MYQYDYRSKYAGDLRHDHIDYLRAVQVKAHLSEQQARDRNEHHWWFANDRVDRLANEARTNLGNPAKEYAQECKVRAGVLHRAADALAEAMPLLHTLEKEQKQRPHPHPTRPHHWLWFETRWCCLDCARTARRKTKQVMQSPCPGPLDVHPAHVSHRLYHGFVDHMPMVFCRDCGGYTATRKGGKLQQQCRPRRSTILTRLQKGQHPVSQKALSNVRPFAKIAAHHARLQSAVQPGQVGHQPPPVVSTSGNVAVQPLWDAQDIAAAVDPYSDHDLDDEWQADFEAACDMNLFSEI
jgi:hypothetical protein